MRRAEVHINLDKLARKIIAEPSPKMATGDHLHLIPRNLPELLELLRKERLALTDYEFRKRYAAWL